MRKVLFFALLLVIFGVVSVSAQVRIGGDGVPNDAAVLDLNADDDTNTGTKGLALPRVNFSTNTAQITSGVANLTGMLVYNTNTTLGVGVYFWDGSQWVAIGGDGIVVDAVTNATADGGLVRAGLGTAASPYTLGIADNGVTTDRIADNAVTGEKIATVAADSGYFLMSNGSVIVPGGSMRSFTTPSGLTLNSAKPAVTWTLIFDDIIIWDVTPRTYLRVPVSGLTYRDICTAYNVQGAFIVHVATYTGYLYMANESPWQGTCSFRVRCVRPSA